MDRWSEATSVSKIPATYSECLDICSWFQGEDNFVSSRVQGQCLNKSQRFRTCTVSLLLKEPWSLGNEDQPRVVFHRWCFL